MTPGIVVGIVEDDAVQAELYAAMFAASGIHSVSFASAEDFRRRLGAESIDVLLLDWNLPGVNGIDLLRCLRSRTDHLPTVLLTANSDERDVVYALQCGADDYIVKPPRAAELIARVLAAHRRASAQAVQLRGTEPFELDLRARELRVRGVPVAVTEKEFDLLSYFFQRKDRIVSRQMLLTEVWNLPAHSATRSIDTYISRLRKSLGLNGDSGWRLEGVYQHGYRLMRASRRAEVHVELTGNAA